MADRLSLFNLPSLLVLDQYMAARDRRVIDLCEKTEQLRRRRRYGPAVGIALKALRLTDEMHDLSLHGIVLLFLSLARHECGTPEQDQQAIHDCEEAIANLSAAPHNHAIAEVFRAQLELEIRRDDPEGKELALAHLRRAADRLQEIITDWRTPDSAKQMETDILKLVEERIAELAAMHGASLAESPAPPGRTRPRSSVSPKPPAIPKKLIWPAPNPSGSVLLPICSVESFKADLIHQEFAPGMTGLNDFLIYQITISGRPYAIYPTPLFDRRGVLQVHLGQEYDCIGVQSGSGSSHADHFVLMRRQDQPDHLRQQSDSAHQPPRRRWIVYETITPRIIGGTRDTSSESTEERVLGVVENASALYSIKDAHMIGIVEAILKPLPPNESYPPSTSYMPPQADPGIDVYDKETD